MIEYGVFDDEGMIDGPFYSTSAAEKACSEYNDEDPDYAHVGEICHDHPEHEADTCEECNQDEDEPEVVGTNDCNPHEP